MQPVFGFLVISTLLVVSEAADLEATCTKDGDCTVTSAYCWKGFTNCDNGKCQCKDGYSASGTTSCLKDKGKGQACDANSACLYGTTCSGSSNTCECPGGKTYRAEIKMCITTGLKLITEECSAESDCFVLEAGSTECVANSGTSSPKYCRCKTGYILENYICRIPNVGEACASVPGCESMVSGLAGQETETCTNSKCTCPSTADKVGSTYQGIYYSLCLTKSNANKANGETCTAHNDCVSKFCDMCPGTATKKCLVPVSGSIRTVAISTALVIAAAIFVAL